MEPRVRSLEEAEHHVRFLTRKVEELEGRMRDHSKRFDTLQTPLLKRIWFRINGWPGQKDLAADSPQWRPWHRWVKP